MTQDMRKSIVTDRSVISVHTKPETNKRLDALASLTRRSKSFLANDAIERYLQEEEAFVVSVQAGIVDADAGRTMTTEELKKSLYKHVDKVVNANKLA